MKNRTKIYNITLIITAFLISILLYSKLPNEMPMHWNAYGEIDNYGPKIFAAFLPPIIMIFIWGGMLFIPKIDPKKENYNKFNTSYTIITNIIVTFFFILHIVVIITSLGYDIPIYKIIPFIIGIIFILIGNYLPKSKSNFFFGIRTPWTLTNEDIWKKTHRLGGKLFVLSGLFITVSSLFFTGNIQFIILVTAILIASIIPIIASYFYYSKNIK
ncbi:SdpI family protein [Clostridium taeniosporum]|uniref:DUF1648 domain-containing protein n=1 Tax=Clostridium taeniosporum TaxID=394958 RepID=A0A1D7XKB2_9CLOT|nr:SdpI family protein [Clostridium taeniosporum]AOR23788.1 hypothetical protein BGI42_08635 [Clostridium taeniosporum]